MSRRQDLLDRLKEIDSGPKRSLGQNFLISDGVIERILEAAAVEPYSELLEIGPGLGALTEGLLDLAKKKGCRFRAIELDRGFVQYWKGRGVETIEVDALKLEWAGLELSRGAKLVSNLPYQISASLVVDRSVDPCGVSKMILMFQKEVAKRITARPQTDDYSLLSVIAQIGWRVSVVSEAGPGDFFPPPRVASRVLEFQRREDAPEVEEFSSFLKFVKAAYSHRRKFMVKNLSHLFPREILETHLQELGFTSQARVEELNPEQLLRYFRSMRAGHEYKK